MLRKWFGRSVHTAYLDTALSVSLSLSLFSILVRDLHPRSLNITHMQLLLRWVFPQTPVLLIYYFPDEPFHLDFLLAAHILHVIKIFNSGLSSS